VAAAGVAACPLAAASSPARIDLDERVVSPVYAAGVELPVAAGWAAGVELPDAAGYAAGVEPESPLLPDPLFVTDEATLATLSPTPDKLLTRAETLEITLDTSSTVCPKPFFAAVKLLIKFVIEDEYLCWYSIT
jgi:hypothetical protein